MHFGNVKSHMVIDCDEVLVRISPKWVYKMHLPENYPIFEEHLHVSKKFDLEKHYETVMRRDKFQLYDWMKREFIEGEFAQSEILDVKEKCMQLYNDPHFYDDLKPTEMAKSISMLARNNNIKKISIVTRNLFDSSAESKRRFINKLFASCIDKVTIYELEKDEKKSDVIKEFDDVSHIFEDEISNVIDIIENCPNLENVIISVPKYGYNVDIPQDITEKAAERGIDIIKYSDSGICEDL